ncbi:alpha/beta hydrolase [Pseudonocardia sp. MCCB 268]|nr:alpha/beta hydrolase [Pseudonocardia cytotoxica]
MSRPESSRRPDRSARTACSTCSGGYLVGSAASHRPLLAGLAHATGTPVHAPAYRLRARASFPAALDDALAACGTPCGPRRTAARRIAVAGDSRGRRADDNRCCCAGTPAVPGAIGLIAVAGPHLHRGHVQRRHRRVLRSVVAAVGRRRLRARQRRRPGAECPLDADLFGLPPASSPAPGARRRRRRPRRAGPGGRPRR